MSKIISPAVDEFTAHKAKQQELEYYQDNLKQLERRQRTTDREIKLTKDIIEIIKQEKIK